MNLELWQWCLAALCAYMIGLSKTGLPGIGILAVTLFTNAFPAKGSVGLVLILLICADVVAVASFHRHADPKHLWRLFPWTIAGVLGGFFTMGKVDDQQVKVMIGGLVAVMVLFQFRQFLRKKKTTDETPPHNLAFVAVMGLTAGFTTMVANAAGPIMILYLLAAGLPKMEFIGTGAWYFLLINLFKVPFSWNLGLITTESLTIDLILAPLAVLGAFSGKVLIPHINQRLFEGIALGFTFLASLKLLFL